MRGRFSVRPFVISFLLTLLAALLILGILAVDTEGRRLSFNDDSPAFEIVYGMNDSARLRVNAFSWGREFAFTWPVRVWHFVADFFCIPRHR